MTCAVAIKCFPHRCARAQAATLTWLTYHVQIIMQTSLKSLKWRLDYFQPKQTSVDMHLGSILQFAPLRITAAYGTSAKHSHHSPSRSLGQLYHRYFSLTT